MIMERGREIARWRGIFTPGRQIFSGNSR